MNLNSQKPLKKFIAKNYKTSPSLTEPYQAFLAIDVKMSLSIFIYHGVRMSLYASFQSVRPCFFKFSNLIIIYNESWNFSNSIIPMVHWPKTELVIKLYFTD